MKRGTGACSAAGRSASVLAFFLSCLGLSPQALFAQGGSSLTAPNPVVVKGDRTLTVLVAAAGRCNCVVGFRCAIRAWVVRRADGAV